MSAIYHNVELAVMPSHDPGHPIGVPSQRCQRVMVDIGAFSTANARFLEASGQAGFNILGLGPKAGV